MHNDNDRALLHIRKYLIEAVPNSQKHFSIRSDFKELDVDLGCGTYWELYGSWKSVVVCLQSISIYKIYLISLVWCESPMVI